MRVEELNFPENVVSILKEEATELNPPQLAAVKSGLLEGRDIVVASPTASGKTLIAEMAFVKNFLDGGKTVYMVPLKALASEKYDEFRKKYERIGMKIALSIGDLDSNDAWLQGYDLIIVSNEKMDSLLRHGVEWVNRITLMIIDEIHLLNDVSRGPTLEVVITRLRATAKTQVIALSATISNAEEIAAWLDARLVKSDYRPIELKKGVYYSGAVDFESEKMEIRNSMEGVLALCRHVLDKGNQALIFVSARRSSEAEAEKIAKKLAVSNADLHKISKDIENALHYPTKQCKRLAGVVKNGTAFHHAGLVAKQRKLIEDNFRSGKIKFLVATPTLAYGVNLPAHTVIVRDVRRYSGYGMDYIPVLEVQQFFGRAGRPRYHDNEGHAILIAKSEHESDELKERYIRAETEPIYSKLSVEPVLRMHVLALIATGFNSRNALEGFFSKTFFAHQYSDIGEVMLKVEKILRELESFGFIKIEKHGFISGEFVPAFALAEDAGLYATPLGKRVSKLYVDPASACHLIQNFGRQSSLEYLLAVNHCTEMWPLLSVREKEVEELEDVAEKSGIAAPDAWDIDYERFLREMKTSLMFVDWANESGEDKLLDSYGIAPGELYTKTRNAEWLLYAARELALILGKRDVANAANKLRIRLKHGIKEELIRLVKLRGIGRARARMLFNGGIKSPKDVKNNAAAVERILGKKIAESISREISDSGEYENYSETRK